MSIDGVDSSAVIAALAEQGLKATYNSETLTWWMLLDWRGAEHRVAVLLPEKLGYFIAVDYINSPLLQVPLERLTKRTLQALIYCQSQIVLAKVHVAKLEPRTIYAAMSPCSIDQWSGKKLRARIEACVALNASILDQLEE